MYVLGPGFWKRILLVAAKTRIAFTLQPCSRELGEPSDPVAAIFTGSDENAPCIAMRHELGEPSNPVAAILAATLSPAKTCGSEVATLLVVL